MTGLLIRRTILALVLLVVPFTASFAEENASALPQESAAAAGTTVAADSLSDAPSLDEYLAYAAAHNPAVSAAQNNSLAASQMPRQAKALEDPALSYSYSIQSDRQRQGLSIEQMFPWPGTLALKEKAALAMSGAGGKRYEASLLDVSYRVKAAYWEHYYLARAIEIADGNLQLLTVIESVVRGRYKTDASSHPELIRIQVELGKLDDELRTLRDMKAATSAMLNAAIGRPAAEERALPRESAPVKGGEEDGDSFARLVRRNPDLAAMDMEVEAADRQVSLARKQFFPGLMLGLEWMDMKASGMEDEFMVMAGVRIPLWRGKYRAGESEARYRRAETAARRQDMEYALSARLASATYRWRDAGRKMNLYRDTLLPKAKEAFGATNAAYQSGSASFTDLLDTQRQLLDFQLMYERALADHAVGRAEIEMLVGGADDSEAPDTLAPSEDTK